MRPKHGALLFFVIVLGLGNDRRSSPPKPARSRSISSTFRGRRDPARDARARVDPDRLGLAGAGRSRPQADRSRPQGPGGMRPARPSGHDPLAHGSLRRRGGARSDWCESAISGTGACPRTGTPGVTFPTAPGRRSAGERVSQGQRGQAEEPESRRTLPFKGLRRWSWPRGARSTRT